MKKIILTILIIVIIAMMFILSGCTSSEIDKNTENKNNVLEEKQNSIEQQEMVSQEREECNHDWVITSKYNFWVDAYKTISKCSKCGKEVE